MNLLDELWDGVPPSWDIARNRFIFQERNQRGCSDLPLAAVSQRHGVLDKRELEAIESRKLSGENDDLSNYKRIMPGDLVYNKMRMWQGAVGLSQMDGLVSPAYVVATPSEKIQPRFAAYLLKSVPYVMQSSLFSYGICDDQNSLRWSDFANLKSPLPNLSEQVRIANFLDDKTARIDALIAEKERLVERLAAFQYSFASSAMTRGLDPAAKLVETSSSEVGAIPSHWKLKRLKFLGDVRSGVAKGKDLGTSETVQLPYLRVANVQDGYLDLTDVHEIEVAESDAQRYLLKRGDVLMNEGGDNDKLGRGAVWQGEVEPCIHQNHVFAVRLRDPNLSDWVARFTSTDAARTYFFLRSKQSTNLASINQSNVRELPVPMPPDAERERILSEVQRVSKNVQDLSGHALKHVARLREYRSSLISAAVTGQLDRGSWETADVLAQ